MNCDDATCATHLVCFCVRHNRRISECVWEARIELTAENGRLKKFGRGGEPCCLHETVTRRENGRYGCVKCDEGFMSCNDAQVFWMKEIGQLESDLGAQMVELDDLRRKIRDYENA